MYELQITKCDHGVELTKERCNNYLSNYEKNYFEVCKFSALNLKEDSDCDEICETYLIETSSSKKMYLPCELSTRSITTFRKFC
jgi:hypothetical protein